MELKEIITLADLAGERLEVVREIQQRLVDFEATVRAQQDAFTEDLARMQGELAHAQGEHRNALLASQEILNMVPMRLRDAAGDAGVKLRAHKADVTRARRDLDAAQAMLDKRREDTNPTLGKEEQKALLEQVSRATVSYDRVMDAHDRLEANLREAETAIAAEVAKIRKSAR